MTRLIREACAVFFDVPLALTSAPAAQPGRDDWLCRHFPLSPAAEHTTERPPPPASEEDDARRSCMETRNTVVSRTLLQFHCTFGPLAVLAIMRAKKLRRPASGPRCYDAAHYTCTIMWFLRPLAIN